MFRILSGPGHPLAVQLSWSFSPVSPYQFPHTVPSPVHPYPQILHQARTLGLRQPEAPVKKTRALRCHLALSRTPHCTPSLRPHSLRAPSAISPFILPWLPLPSLPSPYHRCHCRGHWHRNTTWQPTRPVGPQQRAAGGFRGAGMRRDAMQKGSGGAQHRSEGPLQLCSFFYTAIFLLFYLIQLLWHIYIVYNEGERG